MNRRVSKILLLSMGPIVLSGCSFFSPAYTKPQVNVPKTWAAHDDKAKVSTNNNLPYVAWWQQFNDPELNVILEETLQHNNDIQVALANVQTAQGQLRQIELNWVPFLPLWVGNNQMPAVGNPGYFYGIFPTYALNLLQQIKQQKQFSYQLQASKYAQDSIRLTIIGQTVASYFTLLAQVETLRLYNQLLVDLNKELALYRSQLRNGLISADLIDETMGVMNNIQAQMKVVKNNIVITQNTLHLLANQNPGTIALRYQFNHINSNKIIPADLPATVLQNRPDLLQAEAQLKAANQAIGVAASNLLPTIELGTFAHEAYESSLNNAPQTLSPQAEYLSIPILNLPALGLTQATQATYKANYYTYIQQVRKILAQVDDDLSAHDLYTKRLNENEAALMSIRKICQLNQSRFNNGISSEVPLVECRVQLDNFAIVVNENKLAKMMTIVTLYQDLGGGYLYNTLPKMPNEKHHI